MMTGSVLHDAPGPAPAIPMNTTFKHIGSRISQNDTQALKGLYDLLGDKLLQFAMAIVCSRELAEEVVQDVFIRIWERRHRLHEIDNLKWYLYVITRNISVDYLRKRRKRRVVALEEVCLPEYRLVATPEDLMVTAEIVDRINQAINNLPPKCRLIFKLVKEDGLKYREVAGLLNLSVKTVDNQLGIALKKLNASIAPVLQAQFPAETSSSSGDQRL